MIIGWNLSPREGGRAACVCKGFRACVDRARATKGMLKSDLLWIAAGVLHMVACTARGVFTWGENWNGQLGHGGEDHEWVPRLVQGELAGKKVVGVAAGRFHTVVFTEAGDLYTFGAGSCGRLGHGGTDDENVPRPVGGLAGQRVVSAPAGIHFTAVATERGEVFCFGRFGGDAEPEHHSPELVRSLLN